MHILAAIQMTSQKLQQIGIKTALFTLAICIFIIILVHLTSIHKIIYVEYIFIFIAVVINIIVLLRIINYLNKHKRNRRRLMLTGGFIIFAVLASLVGFRYLTGMLDTMQIRLINNSAYEIKDIKFTGCQRKHLASLKKDEVKTVAIKIKRDCSISVSYKENNIVKTEVISAFVTTSMGQKLDFRIGSNSSSENTTNHN